MQRVNNSSFLSPRPNTELIYRGPPRPWKPFELLDQESLTLDANNSAFERISSDEPEHPGCCCPYGHPLTFRAKKCSGWACDGKDGLFGGFRTKGGCLSGITDFHQSGYLPVWECKICSYDVCEKCCEQIKTTFESYNARVWRLLQAKISESSDQSLSYKSNLSCLQCDAIISEKEQQFIFFFQGQRYCSEYCRSLGTHRATERAFKKLNFEEPKNKCPADSKTIEKSEPTKPAAAQKFLKWKKRINKQILNVGLFTVLGSVLTGVTAVAWHVFFVSS